MRLIYFSPVSWFSFAQRPHRFVEWFHRRTGGEVLWVEPYPTRLPGLSDLSRGNDKVGQVEGSQVPPWLEVVRSRALPIEPLPLIRRFNRLLFRSIVSNCVKFARTERDCLIVFGKPSDLALAALDELSNCPSVYDAMDDFPAFYDGLSRISMHSRERAVVGRVSCLLVSSSHSMERFAGTHRNIRLVLNACDESTLPQSPRGADEDGAGVIGYVGTVGPWFDWALVIELARLRPDLVVRLIGPVHGSVPAGLPENIELCPPMEHRSAMRAAGLFSVGLIPFLSTRLTASVDPIKYYEYRALGVPILSTTFGEMAWRRGEPGVFLVESGMPPDRVHSALEGALRWRGSAENIQAFRRANTWDARFDAAGFL